MSLEEERTRFTRFRVGVKFARNQFNLYFCPVLFFSFCRTVAVFVSMCIFSTPSFHTGVTRELSHKQRKSGE